MPKGCKWLYRLYTLSFLYLLPSEGSQSGAVFCDPSGLHPFEQVSLLLMAPSKGTTGELGLAGKVNNIISALWRISWQGPWVFEPREGY